MLSDSQLATLTPHFEAFLANFEAVSFPKGFGFDPYTLADIRTFLQDPTVFEFSLKKIKGGHVLYASSHIRVRQSLVNFLPLALRLACVLPKLQHHGLMSCFDLHNGNSIVDIRDIGAGHSIYMVSLAQPFKGHRRWVIKREDLPNQSLFCQLLSTLGWPTYQSMHHETPYFNCEISQYLGDMTLYEGFRGRLSGSRDHLETQLAAHAALGGVLGRGDRHFNNYMMVAEGIVPIDISFLFWEGNEAWDARYIAGGMYEFSMLSLYSGEALALKMTQFFDTYYETLQFLRSKQGVLEAQLVTFCGDYQLDAADKLAFIQTRLADIDGYFLAQKTAYLKAFDEMRVRQAAKQRLAEHVSKYPEILDTHPLLKMYYMADLDQPSCFFLWEERPELATLLASLG